jgi:dolichyl-phosphate-mannose-protein mannosyltransferase
MKFDRSVWTFLVLGIALHCVALKQPLVDAHLIRQCQTAAATKSLIAESGFHLSSRAPWLGDLDARYVLELPIYNYLVIGVYKVIGHLDLSGKITSILLWAASFLCLQLIWRRILDPKQTFWANLLFVLAPLSVFYGQAFMPEMLVQLLALGFVLQVLRYDEKPSIDRWVFVVAVGLGALLVKLPETAHLYLLLAFVVFRREGWKALIRPRYLVAAVITICALKGWSLYMDSVNAAYFRDLTSTEALRFVIGPLRSRFEFKRWAMALLYVGAFILPGPTLLATMYGLYAFVRKYREQFLGVWLVSLMIFYLLWFGNGAPAQGYYNLPALAPLCALFGIGMQEILAMKWSRAWPRIATVSAVLLVVLSAIPIWKYLFKQDRQILAAALWTKENTLPTDIILFRTNHRFDMVDYPDNPVPPYCAERAAFIWTKAMPEVIARRALSRASYAIVTTPPPPVTDALAIVNRFRGKKPPEPESMEWLEENGFHSIAKQTAFEVFRKE